MFTCILPQISQKVLNVQSTHRTFFFFSVRLFKLNTFIRCSSGRWLNDSIQVWADTSTDVLNLPAPFNAEKTNRLAMEMGVPLHDTKSSVDNICNIWFMKHLTEPYQSKRENRGDDQQLFISKRSIYTWNKLIAYKHNVTVKRHRYSEDLLRSAATGKIILKCLCASTFSVKSITGVTLQIKNILFLLFHSGPNVRNRIPSRLKNHRIFNMCWYAAHIITSIFG